VTPTGRTIPLAASFHFDQFDASVFGATFLSVVGIKPPQADEMKNALDRDGRIALYINFISTRRP